MNADSLSRIAQDVECHEYDGVRSLAELPCGGCSYCQKRHEEWHDFIEEDDVVPLYSRRVHNSSGEGDREWNGVAMVVMLCMVLSLLLAREELQCWLLVWLVCYQIESFKKTMPRLPWVCKVTTRSKYKE